MMSEKSYWTVLILGLIAFIFVDCFWIVPAFTDIGINLFTDSVFAIFTIVFLSLILSIREKRQWAPLELDVRKKLSSTLCFLAWELVYLLEVHDEFVSFSSKMEHQSVPSMYDDRWLRYQLGEVCKRKQVWVSDAGEKMLTSEEFGFKRLRDQLGRYEKILNEMEAKYSSHLRPTFLHSLMRILENLRKIIRAMDIRDQFDTQGEYVGAARWAISDTVKEISEIEKKGLLLAP
jgi:hypothetical protein